MSQATAPFNSATPPHTGVPQKLWAAIQDGDLDAVKNFVALFPDAVKLTVRAQPGYKDGDRAIHIAARAHKTEIIDFLLANGAGLEDRNTATGETPLLASLGATLNVPLHLIALGADKTARGHKGRNALHIAALSGFTLTAGKLLDAKMDIEERDGQGQTALVLALRWEKPETALLLLERGASVLVPGIKAPRLYLEPQPGDNALWAKVDALIAEKTAAELLNRSIQTSQAAAKLLSKGAGSDVAAPAKAAFRPKFA